MSAAEAAADQIRSETEDRVLDRIAEGQRAADNRVRAAEEEAAEILANARIESEKLRRDIREEAEVAKTAATSEALAIVAAAHQDAHQAREQATQAVATSQREAERYSRELMSEARMTADDVRKEGLELVANLRQMGDSLRANAERLLRDVSAIHSQMVARIERTEGRAAPRSGAVIKRQRLNGGRVGAGVHFEGGSSAEIPDVPEFIPRR